MKLESVKWFEVIFKNENGFRFEKIIADTLENACNVANGLFGAGTWEYVSEI